MPNLSESPSAAFPGCYADFGPFHLAVAGCPEGFRWTVAQERDGVPLASGLAASVTDAQAAAELAAMGMIAATVSEDPLAGLCPHHRRMALRSGRRRGAVAGDKRAT